MINKMNPHGGFYKEKENITDFSANISPLGMPEAVRRAARDAVLISERYPDPDYMSLRLSLSEKYGGDPYDYICGSGAADLIYRIAFAVKDRIEKALIIEPSFSEYERALCLNKTEVERFILKEEDGFKAGEDMLSFVRKRLEPERGLIFMAIPSNPAGCLMDKGILRELMELCRERRIYLVADICFLGFTREYEEYMELFGEFSSSEHLLLLNAFTKLYAMAGLRLGFMRGKDPELLSKIDHSRQPWQLSTPSICAGIAALGLDDKEYREPLSSYVEKEREYLSSELKALGLKVYDGRANYLLFRTDVKNLSEKLEKNGVIIRECSDYKGLGEDFYRIAVLDRKKDQILIDAIKNAMR